MILLVHPPDRFGSVETGQIRMLLARERHKQPGVIGARLRGGIVVGCFGEFQFRPFLPQIQTGGGLNQIGKMRAAYPGGRFEEVDLAVSAANEFRLGHAAHQAERRHHPGIGLNQFVRDGRPAFQYPPALVRHLHRWSSVTAGNREADFAIKDDAVDVKNVARDELFEQVIRLQIAQLVDETPKFLGVLHLLDADQPRHGSRLEHPRRGTRAMNSRRRS